MKSAAIVFSTPVKKPWNMTRSDRTRERVKEAMEGWSMSQIKDRLTFIEDVFDRAPHLIDRDVWTEFYRPLNDEKIAILQLYPDINK